MIGPQFHQSVKLSFGPSMWRHDAGWRPSARARCVGAVMSRLNITVLSIRGSRVQPTKYTIFAHFYCRNIPVREEGGTPLWATSFSVTAAETLILSAVRQSVSRSVGARPVLWNIFRLFFRLPGLTCTHLFLFFNGGPLICQNVVEISR